MLTSVDYWPWKGLFFKMGIDMDTVMRSGGEKRKCKEIRLGVCGGSHWTVCILVLTISAIHKIPFSLFGLLLRLWWRLQVLGTCPSDYISQNISTSRICFISMKFDRRESKQSLRNRRLPPRLSWILSSSGVLRSVRWLETDVSGLPIGPIFNGQADLLLLLWKRFGIFCGI